MGNGGVRDIKDQKVPVIGRFMECIETATEGSVRCRWGLGDSIPNACPDGAGASVLPVSSAGFDGTVPAYYPGVGDTGSYWFHFQSFISIMANMIRPSVKGNSRTKPIMNAMGEPVPSGSSPPYTTR